MSGATAGFFSIGCALDVHVLWFALLGYLIFHLWMFVVLVVTWVGSENIVVAAPFVLARV